MKNFRNLASNIFFKIVLSFVALTFVLFGVSEFILGSPNSWVAKVGDSTISYNSFSQALKNDRELITANSQNRDMSSYLNSKEFKLEVLRRLINKNIINKLRDDLGVIPSRELILKNIANDGNFQNEDGKFDHALFQNFLKKYNLNEQKYVDEIANEIAAAMILQTLTLVAPIDLETNLQFENFKKQQRQAHVVTITTANVKNTKKPSAKEIKDYYEKNLTNYHVKEKRQISYLKITKKDFAKDLKISDSQIRHEYEQNPEKYMEAERRDFYHLIFDDKAKGTAFIESLNKAKITKNNLKTKFINLAKKQHNKNIKEITLNNVTKNDLIDELVNHAFDLEVGNYSQLLESPLGFHVFLLNKTKPQQKIKFNKVKASIKKYLQKGYEERILTQKINEIDDLLLTSNSLEEVAKKYNLKLSKNKLIIDREGQDKNGKKIAEIKNLIKLSENAFDLEEGQSSRIFYTNASGQFYAIKLHKIIKAHNQTLSEVKSQVRRDLIKEQKIVKLQELANKIANKIKENPKKASKIARKYGAKFKKNQKFSRYVTLNIKGREIPYQNPFQKSLFNLKIGQSSLAIKNNDNEFEIAILQKINKKSASSREFEKANNQAKSNFRKDIMQEYDQQLSKVNPIVINEKFFE